MNGDSCVYCSVLSYLHNFGTKKINQNVSGAGFEPTPTRVDCNLNAAP